MQQPEEMLPSMLPLPFMQQPLMALLTPPFMLPFALPLTPVLTDSTEQDVEQR